MKNYYPKALLPLVPSIMLFTLLVGLAGCIKPVCKTGECIGDNEKCYSCDAGTYCTRYPTSSACSGPVSGIYCCPESGGGGGGGGCTPTGCPSSHPWKCGAYCYATPPAGNHSCTKCP